MSVMDSTPVATPTAPGDMMATNYHWCQPLKAWKEYFSQWIDRPEPEALMLTCVFFDLRCIYGKRSLFQELRDHVLDKTPAAIVSSWPT